MEYKNNPNKETLVEIEKTLSFIRKHDKSLLEKPGDSKWTNGHTVFCFENDEPGMYTHMIGALKSGKVTWHMMPMYGVTEMKDRWSNEMSPFVSGKSCINFKTFDELPIEAIENIVSEGGPLFKLAMDAYYAKRKKK